MSKLPSKLKSNQLKLDQMLAVPASRSRSRSPSNKPEPKLIFKDEPKTQPAPPAPSTSKSPVKPTATASASAKSSLIDDLRKKRHELYESVAAFKFNKTRVRVLSECMEIPDNSRGVIYWMSRDQRVQGKAFFIYLIKSKILK
jgi:hypothetical protein